MPTSASGCVLSTTDVFKPWIKLNNLKFNFLLFPKYFVRSSANKVKNYVPVIFIWLDYSAEVVLQSSEIPKVKVRSGFWRGTVETMDNWGLDNLELSPPADNEAAIGGKVSFSINMIMLIVCALKNRRRLNAV